MKLLITIFLIFPFFCLGQQSAKGNYLMISPWTISFIKLKKNNSVKWYKESCTERGTRQLGEWKQKGDIVLIELDDKITEFLIIKNALCPIKENGGVTELEYGIDKTRIQTNWRVKLRAKRIRKLSYEE